MKKWFGFGLAVLALLLMPVIPVRSQQQVGKRQHPAFNGSTVRPKPHVGNGGTGSRSTTKVQGPAPKA